MLFNKPEKLERRNPGRNPPKEKTDLVYSYEDKEYEKSSMVRRKLFYRGGLNNMR